MLTIFFIEPFRNTGKKFWVMICGPVTLTRKVSSRSALVDVSFHQQF